MTTKQEAEPERVKIPGQGKIRPSSRIGRIYQVGRPARGEAEELRRINTSRRKLGLDPINSLAELGQSPSAQPPADKS